MADTLYVARFPWFYRWVTLGIHVAMFAFFGPRVPGILRDGDWFLGLMVATLFLLATFCLLEMFLRKTVLTEAGIYHRSVFGLSRFVPYRSVRKFELAVGGDLVIKTQCGRPLKIFAKEGDLDEIMDAMAPFLDPEVRIVTHS